MSSKIAFYIFDFKTNKPFIVLTDNSDPLHNRNKCVNYITKELIDYKIEHLNNKIYIYSIETNHGYIYNSIYKKLVYSIEEIEIKKLNDISQLHTNNEILSMFSITQDNLKQGKFDLVIKELKEKQKLKAKKE